MVGRITELAKLNDWFAQVKTGSRRVIFVSGEPGIGKTTLTRAFVDSQGSHRGVRIGRGQCVEQYGAGEPYMPILEALTRLCREPGGDKLVEILHRLAPAWLAQMPSLVSAEDRARLQGLAQGTTQQRMLREMAEALEVISAESSLVLFIEDLHWSDPSTLDLIATVARRSEHARLMILGTYRPVEMLAGEHPLRAMKEELELHQQAIELRLPLLSESDVAEYVAQRVSDGEENVGPAVYARTEGNPLFMVNVVDYLIEHDSLLDTDKIEAPRNIRQMIERNLQRLSPDEQRVLEAASVAGAQFSVAAVAAALERPVSEIEGCCIALGRREQFVSLQGSAEWPDGTIASNVRFLHALYREVLYDHVPPGHRVVLHRRIAEREETGHGEQAGEIAAELADHLSRANDSDKAVKYFRLAGERAATRSALVEAARYYTRALELLSKSPESPERDRRELDLQLAVGPILISVKGYAAEQTERVYTRALELCERLGNPPELISTLHGLWARHFVRGEMRAAYDLAEELLRRAQSEPDQTPLLLASWALGDTSVFMGEFLPAKKHIDIAVALYEPERDRLLAYRYLFIDAGVNCLAYAAWTLWHLGYPDQAVERGNEALAIAQGLSHPHSLALAGFFIGTLRQHRREAHAARENALSVMRLSAEHGLPDWLGWATTLHAWALAQEGRSEEGLAQMRQSLAALSATGAGLMRPHDLCFLAEVCMEAGRLDEGLDAIAEALSAADEHENRMHESEINRLKGELLLKQDDSKRAEAQSCFERAIEVARKQSAKSWELRATMSLARLLVTQGCPDEARAMLAEIYGWFTEGFDTKDLKDAKSLLDELGVGAG
jgi:predicted ATPase